MMKRGLSTLDSERTPVSGFRQRQEGLRELARQRGLEAILVYGDVSAGGDIAFLTHTTLYWGHAILVVPADGPTVLAMSLSPRTHNWFRETGVLDEMVSGPRIGELTSQVLADRRYANVGVVDQDYFPDSMLRAFREQGVQLTDLGPAVRRLRSLPDEVTLADAKESARLGAAGLEAAAAAASSGDVDLIRAEAEYAMRSSGAWDATAVVTQSEEGLAVQLRCQVRDAWSGAERFMIEGVEGNSPQARQLYEDMCRQLRPGITEQKLRDFVLDRITAGGDFPESVLFDVVLEGAPDVEARQVLYEVDSEFADGSVVHAALLAWDEAGLPLGALGDTFLISPAGAARLTEVS